jgi:hypothetical protein
MPRTTASPRRVTVPTARISEYAAAASAAARTPSQGLPVNQLVATAVKQPISIMPSRPMLKTPARSQTAPPSAASRIGVSARSADMRRSESRNITRPPWP